MKIMARPAKAKTRVSKKAPLKITKSQRTASKKTARNQHIASASRAGRGHDSKPEIRCFRTFEAFHSWLERHHAKKHELWVRMYKKRSGKTSTDWQTSVRAALCWGWIDSIAKSVDESCYIQRFSPRRPKSVWSRKNRQNVADMIAEGKMREPGMVHVRSAKKDGRWAAAY
eukprot:TRINITY_DN92397_c0_g1_i1.p1 TRINITY_DN92397_c0_g1~~TRINITY_DN92397_c0_g1_i1.p1  ORF type:complete len:171 (-),score=15.41 TRINITY_DN92397_c0_g1_i1:97-609(-)